MKAELEASEVAVVKFETVEVYEIFNTKRIDAKVVATIVAKAEVAAMLQLRESVIHYSATYGGRLFAVFSRRREV